MLEFCSLFFLDLLFFWMRTVFNVFIELAKMLPLFHVLLYLATGMRDHSYSTRDQTCISCVRRWSLNTGLLETSQNFIPFRLSRIPFVCVCVYTPPFVYPFICWWTFELCLLFMAIVTVLFWSSSSQKHTIIEKRPEILHKNPSVGECWVQYAKRKLYSIFFIPKLFVLQIFHIPKLATIIFMQF